MLPSAEVYAPNVALMVEPATAIWRDLATYDARLVAEFIEPLEYAARQHGTAPHELQTLVLQQLHWYFTVDLRERAPTVVLTKNLSLTFHERVRQIMGHVDAAVLEELDDRFVSAEVRHILFAYQEPVAQSQPTIDAVDHDQGLIRLSYFIHSEAPSEEFAVDGKCVHPAYAKYRACHCYHRTLLKQRIAWLPISAGSSALTVKLNGKPVAITIGPQPFRRHGAEMDRPQAGQALLAKARQAYPPGKGGQQALPAGLAGWKVRLVKALASALPVRRRFAKAWVFIDREESADDNAEHLYRWVRANHPEVNAWFLLQRTSEDWPRLEAEGFRLMAPGLARRLLILNSEHILSSHTDYVFGGMDRMLYGDAMQWRYTFLQHGVIKDELSHWLGPREFDCFITSSPGEHESVAGDNTAYPYTDREVKRTGLPRHDRLLRIAKAMPPAEVNTLLVMPTWRGGLVDGRLAACNAAEQMALFAASDYARHWREFLRNDELREMAAKANQRVVFMPHANAAKYIEAFDPPSHVQVVMAETSHIQTTFARAAAFVTDYTSVAFTMAFLRRPVFYYQFDQERFYSGDHNWRLGYFDYERDGFGPVALSESDLMDGLRRYFGNGLKSEREYLLRMERAMPEQDELACHRVYASVLGLRAPFASC